jgi:hypothetical protein
LDWIGGWAGLRAILGVVATRNDCPSWKAEDESQHSNLLFEGLNIDD